MKNCRQLPCLKSAVPRNAIHEHAPAFAGRGLFVHDDENCVVPTLDPGNLGMESGGSDPIAAWELAGMTNPISVLVHRYANGDKESLDQLLPLVYTELRRIAQAHLRNERSGHTLQPTALVNEVYLRLAGQDPPNLQDRVHFLSLSAQVMRQILIDHARVKFAQKRGGRQEKLSLDEIQEACSDDSAIVIQVDDALKELERLDARKARLVEMRFFGGMTAEESAALLSLPVNVVRRELRVAQAWLQRELDNASQQGR